MSKLIAALTVTVATTVFAASAFAATPVHTPANGTHHVASTKKAKAHKKHVVAKKHAAAHRHA